MKKKIKLAVLIMTTAVLAVGCAKNTDSKKDSATDSTKKEAATNIDYSKYVTLGDYKGIEVEKPTVEVTDEDVDSQIQATLQSKAVNEPITDRDTVADGDVVNIDYEGLLDGTAFDGGTAQGQYLTIGSGQFVPGFEEQLVGVKVGDKVSINVTFPENYSENLAGKEVVFNVTLNSINKEVVPELNDEFVAANSDVKTVDEYKQSVREDINASKLEQAQKQKQSNIWAKVKENCKINEYPQELIDKYSEQINTMYSSYAQQAGVEMNEFMTTYFGMSVEDYAKQVAGEEMIFKLIVKDAKLSVSDEEFKQKADEMAKTYGYESGDALITEYGEDQLKDSILYDVMMNYLTENAKEV